MLIKVREFVNIKILEWIYYAIFDCQLNYPNTVWGQNRNSVNRLIILQRKSLHIMSFECRNAEDLNSSFFRHEIIKLSDKSIVEYYLFISKSINFNLPFNHWFTFCWDSRKYETSSSSNSLLKVKTVNSKKYGREAMINNAI